jgi:hypothetical protein
MRFFKKSKKNEKIFWKGGGPGQGLGIPRSSPLRMFFELFGLFEKSLENISKNVKKRVW